MEKNQKKSLESWMESFDVTGRLEDTYGEGFNVWLGWTRLDPEISLTCDPDRVSKPPLPIAAAMCE